MTTHTERTPEQLAELATRLARRSLHYHWKQFVIEGALLATIGATAVIVPNVATLATEILIGWLLLVVGVAGLASRFANSQAPGFWPGLALATLTTLLGAILAFSPTQGIITLTIALTAYFVAHGIYMLLLTVSVRENTGHWLWLVLSALIDTALVFLILGGWPGTATWIIGLFVGLNLLFGGFGLIFAALGARSGSANNA